MDIWELEKLYLFILFVIPGFISLKTYDLIYPSGFKDSSKQLIDAIAYSCVNYALVTPLIIGIERSTLPDNHPYWHLAFYSLVLFFSPILIVLIWKQIRNIESIKNIIHHPTEKPWDYVFGKGEHYWVKAVMKDGSTIGGYYGENSHTSSAPALEQIYIEETWVINESGEFERPKKDSAGVIILHDELSHIELRK